MGELSLSVSIHTLATISCSPPPPPPLLTRTVSFHHAVSRFRRCGCVSGAETRFKKEAMRRNLLSPPIHVSSSCNPTPAYMSSRESSSLMFVHRGAAHPTRNLLQDLLAARLTVQSVRNHLCAFSAYIYIIELNFLCIFFFLLFYQTRLHKKQLFLG